MCGMYGDDDYDDDPLRGLRRWDFLWSCSACFATRSILKKGAQDNRSSSFVCGAVNTCSQAYGKLKRMLKRYAFQRSMRKKGDEDEELKFAREEGARHRTPFAGTTPAFGFLVMQNFVCKTVLQIVTKWLFNSLLDSTCCES